jgi:crotonobetaine/carnitine-CoA ligase
MGERPFLRFEAPDGRVTDWTYAEFDAVVARVAGGLEDAGVVPGRAVSLALANSPAFVAVWLAATRLGAWIVPSDPQATTPELLGHLTRTKAALGVCATARADVYRAAAEAAGVVAVEVAEDDTELGVLSGAGARALPADAPRPRPLDRAAVMFTSGTTSAPKGVEVTQANYAFAGDVMAAAAGLGASDRLIVVLPMFHANAQY